MSEQEYFEQFSGVNTIKITPQVIAWMDALERRIIQSAESRGEYYPSDYQILQMIAKTRGEQSLAAPLEQITDDH